jgi:hypothetical protein
MRININKMNKRFFRLGILVTILQVLCGNGFAQINTVEYGRNKVQYKKFKWKYYQTKNFNIYYTDKTKYYDIDNNSDVTKNTRSDNGEAIAKYIAQIAEKELPEIENNAESGLQRRANIILYNSYGDYKQTNIGQQIDWQVPGGTTKLVNNKVAVYYNSDHQNLKNQVREAIARILVDNVLFGDDIGEIASNQALLDLPKWLTDGYVKYLAENWNTDLDDELKSALLSGSYRTFYQFAFDKPMLAGHAFWRFIEDNYKKDNVTYFFYLTRVYKSLNSASEKICKKKFKFLLQEFMEKESEKYYEDLRKRKNNPRGKLFTLEDVSKKDFFKFQANPAPRNQDYAVVEYKKGVFKVYLVEGWVDKKLLLKFGVRTNYTEYNNQYPLLAWDPKGTRLSVMYNDEGKIKLFVFDAVRRIKIDKTTFPSFDQVQDMNYMLNSEQLLFSAVKNGQSDIYLYNIKNQKLEQITNDIYDDLDPSYVTFPSKTGIVYSSNRPQPESPSNDTILPGNPYNIYLVDDWNKSQFKRLSKLTDVKFGNARYPAQYNVNHFTFVNDEKGVANRYAGFFNSTAAGLDTLIYVGNTILHNPSGLEVDSLLYANKKNKPDSVSYFRVTDDSTYTFPITNYESGIVETRMSGDRDQISETRREGDYKYLYKLRIDDDKLRRRNVNIKPTTYMEKVYLKDRIARGEVINSNVVADTTKKPNNDLFQTEFKEDSTAIGKIFDATEPVEKEDILGKAKKFPYQLKFSMDYLMTGFNNTVLANRYRPYNFGKYVGNVGNTNPNPLNGMTRFGVSDLMEDIRFTGAFRTPTNLDEFEWLFSIMNFRRRVDWGGTYYRQTYKVGFLSNVGTFSGKYKSNLYQLNVAYPFAETKAIKANIGLRFDRYILSAQPNPGTPPTINQPPYFYSLLDDSLAKTGLAHIEYVQDYTLNPATNIWNGLRWKMYLDVNAEINKNVDGKFTYNLGGDARHYLPIYRHITWATRVAADFSWGNRKVLYYLGGIDQGLRVAPNLKSNGNFRYFNEANVPANDQNYAYEAFSQNLRGFLMNTANGNNVVVINSEVRIPIWSTFFSKPVNNAFLRNLQLVQFFDFGTAWNGKYNAIKRPSTTYSSIGSPVSVNVKVGGVGPFAGSYGFGIRSVLLGYFIRFDAGWQMNGFFKNKPVYQFGTGLDF